MDTLCLLEKIQDMHSQNKMVIIQAQQMQNKKEGYFIHGFLKTNLDHVKHNVLKKDFDSFLIVTGREGFGKSTLAAQIAFYLDPTFNLSRCCFTADQFEDTVVKAKKFEAIVFDETMGYLSSRGAMSSFNRQLIKIFSEMRSKNLFVLLCIPNFFELDRYPAMHRATGLIHVYERKKYGVYNYPTKKKLYLKGKKTYSYCVPPNFIGNYPKFFVYDKDEYEEKKQKAIKEWAEMKKRGAARKYKGQRNAAIKILTTICKYPMKEIVKATKLNQRTIKDIIA